MSKKKKIILWISILVILVFTVAFIASYDLIMIIKDGVFETQETISQKKEEETAKQEEALKSAGVSNIRPLTEEETKELTDGNLTEEEAVKIITGQTTMEEVKEKKETSDSKNEESFNKNSSSQNQQPEQNAEQPGNDKSTEDINNKIAELIGKIYIIEARFTSEIGALEEYAVSEYNATPKADKAAKKKELAAYGFPKLTALEKECDAEVNAVLSELSSVLKDAGQSTEIVTQIKSAYTNKKKLTKSYYISEYM